MEISRKLLGPALLAGAIAVYAGSLAVGDAALLSDQTWRDSPHGAEPLPDSIQTNQDSGLLGNSAARTLFGTPIKNDPNDLDKLPETPVALELKGTFAHSAQGLASALIAESGKDSKRVFLGEQITAAIELVRVEKEAVVLRRNNQDEVLRMKNFGEINIGPEVNYRNRQVNSGTTETADTPDLSALPEYTAETTVASPATFSNSSNSNDSSRLSAQERLAKLRERYSN